MKRGPHSTPIERKHHVVKLLGIQFIGLAILIELHQESVKISAKGREYRLGLQKFLFSQIIESQVNVVWRIRRVTYRTLNKGEMGLLLWQPIMEFGWLMTLQARFILTLKHRQISTTHHVMVAMAGLALDGYAFETSLLMHPFHILGSLFLMAPSAIHRGQAKAMRNILIGGQFGDIGMTVHALDTVDVMDRVLKALLIHTKIILDPLRLYPDQRGIAMTLHTFTIFKGTTVRNKEQQYARKNYPSNNISLFLHCWLLKMTGAGQPLHCPTPFRFP
jgi:hypothetical protein